MSPETFEQTLRNYDPALSVRWGHMTKSWVIERSCLITPQLLGTLISGMRKAIALLGNPQLDDQGRYLLQKACEEGYSAGYGKRVIIYAKYLDNRVFDQLLLTDLQAPGALARIEQTKNRAAAEKKQSHHDSLHEISRETINVVEWASRKHSAEVEAGKSAALVAEAFHKPAPRGTRQQFAAPKPLLDHTGSPVHAAPKKDVRIHLASH